MEMSLPVAMGLVFLVGSLLLIGEVVISFKHYSKVEPRLNAEDDIKYSRTLKDTLCRNVFVIGGGVAISEAILVLISLASIFYK